MYPIDIPAVDVDGASGRSIRARSPLRSGDVCDALKDVMQALLRKGSPTGGRDDDVAAAVSRLVAIALSHAIETYPALLLKNGPARAPTEEGDDAEAIEREPPAREGLAVSATELLALTEALSMGVSSVVEQLEAIHDEQKDQTAVLEDMSESLACVSDTIAERLGEVCAAMEAVKDRVY
ncbi:hypothetical protein ATCC90586_001978 [Pythium insidiosum]|nr:hypothetical protein ATCC90586_001978 [Pythium insidiosum]